nr:hypothetical protein [Nitrosomonas nitrosa]
MTVHHRTDETISWPESIEGHVAGLPQRWLLRSDRVSVLLAGLGAGQCWVIGPLPQECLLVVTFGQICLGNRNNGAQLNTRNSIVLSPEVKHYLYASGAADFMLMNVTVQNLWQRPLSKRVSAFTTPQRLDLFEWDYAHVLS